MIIKIRVNNKTENDEEKIILLVRQITNKQE